jgi:GNAT superfamily N-acetyltransferase
VPSRRRHGVGQELLDALLEQVGDEHSAFTMLRRFE